MWIDSHCHLNHPKIAEIGSPSDVIAAANLEGVEGMLTICCRVADEFDEVLEIAKTHKNVWCTVGTHPHDAGQAAEKAITKDDIVRIANSEDKVVGIGETGLDYYYNNSSPEDQQAGFRKHLQACIETGLPVIVHSRDADEDMIRIIREEGEGTNLKGVMHCFSSGPELAEQALDFGFYISFSGIVTFKKADELREIARNVPLDKVLVETDAPYLAPEPYRGKTNQPAYVTHTGTVLADLYKIDKEKLANHSKQNFFTLFSKAEMA